jgi:recombination protein RecT
MSNHEVALTKSETYIKSAMNALDRQMVLGLKTPKNFDVQGALGYTALKIMDSSYPISKEVIIDTMIRVAQKGLDPRKDQLYVLPNKKGQIMLMESYFGYEKLAYDIDLIEKGSVYADVVRKGEKVTFGGRTLEHEKTLETQDNDIIGAYAKAKINGIEISQYMTAYQISMSWSKTNSLDRNFVEETRKGQYGEYTVKTADTSKLVKGQLTAFNENQANFPVEMAKRTVIKNLLKPIVKSYAEASVAGTVEMSNENDETVIKEAEIVNDDFMLEETKTETETVKAESQQSTPEESQPTDNQEVEDIQFDFDNLARERV